VKTDPDAALPRAAIPADVEAPDKLIYNLTSRQVAILTIAATLAYALWRLLLQLPVPLPVAAAPVIPVFGTAVALALGRRDGVSLDRWLLAAILYRRTPKRLVSAPEGVAPPPPWAPAVATPPPNLTSLRLPASSIADTGVIDLGGGTAAAMVAATTVNIALRTADEQHALLGAYARWLNALAGPVQVAVSTQRVDLYNHAIRISDTAVALADPALADAAMDYAEFLLDLAAERDPLWRTVTVVCTAAGTGSDVEVLRRAQQTSSALSALGVTARILDGATAAAVVTAAVDPYQYADGSWPRALPTEPVTICGGTE
jgi:hypothetical protein